MKDTILTKCSILSIQKAGWVLLCHYLGNHTKKISLNYRRIWTFIGITVLEEGLYKSWCHLSQWECFISFTSKSSILMSVRLPASWDRRAGSPQKAAVQSTICSDVPIKQKEKHPDPPQHKDCILYYTAIDSRPSVMGGVSYPLTDRRDTQEVTLTMPLRWFTQTNEKQCDTGSNGGTRGTYNWTKKGKTKTLKTTKKCCCEYAVLAYLGPLVNLIISSDPGQRS